MEIPLEVQQKLKCSECNELLSCGPVYLLHETGGAICGRCSQQSEEEEVQVWNRCRTKRQKLSKSLEESSDRTLNEPYEATASLLVFPCAFAARGCSEKVQFSLGRPPHESSCKFRPFICPVAPSGTCDWFDSWPTLKEHCDEKHPLNIFANPCKPPRPDLTTTNLKTYVISAFRFLFLLHIKVCVASGKLFHSIRMLGDSKLLDTFSYSLEIEGNGSMVKKNGSVLRPGNLTIQETTANFVLINSLLGILDGKYNESKFTIAIQTSIIFNCLNCLKNINDVSDVQFCEGCQGKLVKCKFNKKSCSIVDVDKKKCDKHEQYFCKYQTKCCWCQMNFVGGSFIEHMGSSTSCREIIKSNIDSVVRVTLTASFKHILFSSNNIGTILSQYTLSKSNFYLRLYTSLLSYELKNYKCSIELTDPQTKHTQHLTPQIIYNNTFDWIIDKKLDNFPSWKNDGIDIKVNMGLYKNID